MFLHCRIEYENKEATDCFLTEDVMAKDLKAAVQRSADTLIGDAFGLLALVVILLGGLYLPLFF